MKKASVKKAEGIIPEKITREMKGADCIYRDEKGEILITYDDSLDWLIRVKLEPLRDFLDITFEDDEAQKMAFIAAALLEKAEKEIYELSEYIEKHYGVIKVRRVSHNQSVEPYTMLDIVFAPSKEMTA